MYRKSIFEEKGYAIPTTWEEFVALGTQMQTDGLIPMAFGDLDGWPAMGTFDILNMRINGYKFHVDLMAGRESWTDPRVTAVFEAWKALIPYYSDGALGLTWQEAAQQFVNGQAGMYFLGTFAAQQAASQPEILADIDFFPFPTLGTEFDGELGIDAPIDGFAIPALAQNVDGAKTLLKCFATGAAQDLYTAISTGDVSAANDASTDHYNQIQKKSAEIIAGSSAIAQFLDRDTVPAFAGPNGMQGLLQTFLSDPDQDLAAYQQTIQDAWDTLSLS
jgi:multiple sugar transport system substrate-binding protein